jgi:hypothetical protein
MGKGKYASWMDSLLEEGIWLSEFKKLVKEKFPGAEVSLKAHVCYRRGQGWKIEEKCERDDIFYKVVEKSGGKIQYASWMDSLLEEGIWLSEFKKLVKERLPGVNVSFTYHVRYRRSQGWKIEERCEGSDVFYKVVEKPSKEVKKADKRSQVKAVERSNEGVPVSEVKESLDVAKKKVIYGAGVYVLQEVDGKFKMSVRVGTESRVLEFEHGDVEELIGNLFGGEAELKRVDREGEIEKGVFVLYKMV